MEIGDLPLEGELRWAESEGDRRPVLIVSRSEAVGRLNRLIVAPLTGTVRSIPTQIPPGEAEELPVECAASFDNRFPGRFRC